MSKKIWKPGTMLYPVPAVMVSCIGKDDKPNIITIAWTGTICSNPPMLYVSVRPDRYSYQLLKEGGDFVVNLPNKALTFATDYCGVTSGRDVDKFEKLKLTPAKSEKVNAPYIEECPVNIECKIFDMIELGSHHMFLANVLAVHVDASLLDEKDGLHLEQANLITYNHGQYFDLHQSLGFFGYSIRKKKKIKRER